MRKLIFLDIDGTIISYRTNPAYIPEPTLKAIRLLQEAGHVVAFATARGYTMTVSLMSRLGVTNAVLCNGAHVFMNNETVKLDYIDDAVVKLVTEQISQSDCAAFAADEKAVYTHNATDESIDYFVQQAGDRHAIKTFAAMSNACIIDIYGSYIPDSGIIDKARFILEKNRTEILPMGTSKAQGIRLFAEIAGISMQDTYAVGDGGNDIEMLGAAGTGIAVGNASQLVKEYANIITDAIEDGGVYTVFKQLGLI